MTLFVLERRWSILWKSSRRHYSR